jgi:anti-sigma B factor antagonist
MHKFVILRDTPEKGEIVIRLGKSLDISNTQQLATILTRAHADDHKRIILDCSKLEFVSSAGIGVIVSKNRLINSKNNELILYNVPEIIMFVLNELDVADLLTIKSDLNMAITRE